MNLDNLHDLRTLDELHAISTASGDILVHKDHRWLLPLIHAAQQQGCLPIPTNLAMFDAHHDALEPACLDRIRSFREGGFSTGHVIELCRQDLWSLDDDWLRAGMHLGLIGDAVLFGVERHDSNEFPMDFTDESGSEHRIELLELPGHALKYQGSLSDLAKS